MCKENYVWNSSMCACEIDYAYMKSLINDSVISCDEIIDVLDNVLINLNDKKATC